MFYEMKEKRRPRTASPARWWLTAALSAAAAAVAFAALFFWLGLAIRQPPEATSPADRYPGAPSPPMAGRHSQPYNAAGAAASTPRVEYPTAEILKTTIKNKKGRVEMVEATATGVVGAGPDKVVSVVDGLATAVSAADAQRPPPAPATATAPVPTTVVQSGSRDAYAVDEKSWPDAQLRSKMAQLADAERRRLGDGVSPLDESPSAVATAEAIATAGGYDDGHSSLVRKKSEATLPAWYDASLQQRPPPRFQQTETEPEAESQAERGKWKGDGGSWGRDGVYELADFSRIEPDLSAFNSKTIPAFTYLKEPLPQRPATDTEPVVDVDEDEAAAENGDDDADDTSGDAGASSDDASSYAYQQRRQQPQSDIDPPGTRYHRKEEVAAAAAAENALMSTLRKRLAAVQQWLLYGSGGGGDRNGTFELADLANAFDSSLLRTKSVASLLHKLKAMYGALTGGGGIGELRDTSLSKLLYPSSPSALANTTSLVSFGLLAIDLFLLHNVQQIVWNEQSEVSEQMLRDPEVVALNALFMSPERVRRLQQRADSRVLGAASASADNDDDDDRRRKSGGGVAHDLVEFVNGSLRAILNLSKAYKSSTAHRKSDARSASGGSTLDCIWTLYCRNLDKTAKLRGPYGFLAKMNGLGLRLMMGEFPVDKAVDRLIKEYNGGWSPLDCEKLFPRCKADEAKEVVIETALRRSPA